jgi:hypothetical protein
VREVIGGRGRGVVDLALLGRGQAPGDRTGEREDPAADAEVERAAWGAAAAARNPARIGRRSRAAEEPSAGRAEGVEARAIVGPSDRRRGLGRGAAATVDRDRDRAVGAALDDHQIVDGELLGDGLATVGSRRFAADDQGRIGERGLADREAGRDRLAGPRHRRDRRGDRRAIAVRGDDQDLARRGDRGVWGEGGGDRQQARRDSGGTRPHSRSSFARIAPASLAFGARTR